MRTGFLLLAALSSAYSRALLGTSRGCLRLAHFRSVPLP
jgi:hypothetical protein